MKNIFIKCQPFNEAVKIRFRNAYKYDWKGSTLTAQLYNSGYGTGQCTVVSFQWFDVFFYYAIEIQIERDIAF